MSGKTQRDRAYEVFQRINDFLPQDTVADLRKAREGTADEQWEFKMKHGPRNYDVWDRDLQIIEDTLYVLDH